MIKSKKVPGVPEGSLMDVGDLQWEDKLFISDELNRERVGVYDDLSKWGEWQCWIGMYTT